MKIYENTHEWLTAANPEKPTFASIRAWINEELDEFEEAEAKGDVEGMYDAIADCNIFLANIPYFYNLRINTLSAIADMVNESNWTKFCKTEKEAIETVTAYAKGTHPNKLGKKIETYYEYSPVGEVYVVKEKNSRKILKSINFQDTQEFQ